MNCTPTLGKNFLCHFFRFYLRILSCHESLFNVDIYQPSYSELVITNMHPLCLLQYFQNIHCIFSCFQIRMGPGYAKLLVSITFRERYFTNFVSYCQVERSIENFIENFITSIENFKILLFLT